MPGYTEFFSGNPLGNMPFGKLRVRWEENIEMNFREIRGKDERRMKLAQDFAHWLRFRGVDPSEYATRLLFQRFIFSH